MRLIFSKYILYILTYVRAIFRLSYLLLLSSVLVVGGGFGSYPKMIAVCISVPFFEDFCELWEFKECCK
jgi:hypothetical protein